MSHLGALLPRSLLVVALALCTATVSLAQSGEPIKVEVGKTTLLRMEQRPEVIFIANPAIVDIVIERAGATFLVGRQTGETNMHLLDGNGETIMNAIIVVVPQEARHLTLHLGGRETTFSCNPRCAGVPNPHAAGANVGGADVNLAEREEGTGAPRSQQQDTAATAAAAAAAAAAATAAQQQPPAQPSKPSRPPYAPLNR